MKKYTKKYYSKTDGMFHIKTYKNLVEECINDVKYKTFKSFAEAINNNFDGVDLYYYKFKRNEIHRYDLSKALLNADSQKEIGTFNEKLYNKLKGQFNFDTLDDSKYELCLGKPQFDDADCYDNNIIYISDIHLNCKKEFSETFNKPFNAYDLIYYIKQYADKLVEAYNKRKRLLCFNDFCFILGDLSNNIIMNYFFLKMVKGRIKNVYYVLGNHELWNYDNICDNINDKLSQISVKYSNMLDELDINFLNNTLFVNYGYKNIKKFDESQLEEMNIKDIREACIKSSFIVFGGTGFAGYNDEYNAERQIYRETLSREDEIKETLKFERLYDKLVEACKDLKVTIATHMPFEDWCKGSRVNGWTYINGHTHKNGFIYDIENNIKDFHDNQVGYNSQSISFRNVPVKNTYDIFKDYKDGIYNNISKEDYIDFYRGHNIHIDFNNNNYKKLYLLKNSGFCFFMMIDNNDNLYYLEGGNKRKTINKDINYYYDNMAIISKKINNEIKSLQDALKIISKYVKRFKGYGRIHGTIVDIDFYNHIYFNIVDKSLTYYYADNQEKHIVYENLASLLYDKNKQLYLNYSKLLELSKDNGLVSFENASNTNVSIKTQKYDGTKIYKISKAILKYQYTYNYKILRIWKDEMIDKDTKVLPLFIENELSS